MKEKFTIENDQDLEKEQDKEKEKKPEKKAEKEQGISRRKFLKTAGIVAAGLAAGLRPDSDAGADSIVRKKINDIRQDLAKEKQTEKKQQEKVKPQEMGPKELAGEILRCFNSRQISQRFDNPEVFSPDFFIAHQFQESRFKHKRTSSSGAKGLYQNKPKSVIDVVEYLNNIRETSGLDYRGPKSLDVKEAQEVARTFLDHPDYGRAVGKLYLLNIYDPEYKYNQPPNPNVFAGRTPREIQRKLLVAYHDGPSARYKTDSQLIKGKENRENAVNYYKSVFKHMENLDYARRMLRRENVELKSDYPLVLILRELDRKENKKNPKRAISRSVKRIKRETAKKGRPLEDVELRQVFEPGFRLASK